MNTLLKKLLITIAFVVSIITFAPTVLVYADSNDFSIMPVLPENQNADVQSYFDLVVAPNQKQVLSVRIKNNSENNQKYSIYVNTAATNQNGIIDYSMPDFKKDESMKISLKDLITLNTPQIEVPANNEKEVTFELSLPEEPFDGILLGGITVEPLIEKEKEGINSVLTRTLAIQLAETEVPVTPELKAGEVVISQENYRNNIKFTLRNVSATIISKVKAEISIVKKGAKKPILEQKREQMSIAPNSTFDLMTEWKNQFEVGKYMYTIHLSDESGHRWSFKKEFEIEEKNAYELNNTSVDEKKSSINKYFLYIVSGLLMITICIFLLTNQKHKKESKKSKATS